MFDGEPFYGVQIATNVISEALAAIDMAADAGASFVDLNCGCPIHGTLLSLAFEMWGRLTSSRLSWYLSSDST
jgi:hypothetical protein